MEFEVRVVGGIESCFVSLPLPLIQTLQSSYLPPILAVELRCDARLWQVAWCGAASSSSPYSIEIARQYADCIGLGDRTVVKVRVVSNLPKATLVTIEPLTEDDWEILELNSELAENAILKQVGIVHEEMRFPLWLHGQTVVMFHVMSTFPPKTVGITTKLRCYFLASRKIFLMELVLNRMLLSCILHLTCKKISVQLVPGTEVAVAPKRRRSPSVQCSEEDCQISKAQLRVQDADSIFSYRCEENGVTTNVMFTSGAFVHPETANKYSLSSLQFVVISPRLVLERIKKKHQSKNNGTEKEASNGDLTDNQGSHQVVVRILLSEGVAKGHIMLSESLRLYLGAELHTWVHVKRSTVSIKKEIPQVSVSPYHFKFFQKSEVSEDSGAEVSNNLENYKSKDVLQRFGPLTEMGIGDWSVHDKIVRSLSSVSFTDGGKETTTKTGNANAKVVSGTGLSPLLRLWCLAQIEIVVSNSSEAVNSLVIGSKTLLHFKIRDQRLDRHGKAKTSIKKLSRNRNQAEEPSVDILYILSLSEESQRDKDMNVYELAFENSSRKDYSSRSLDVMLRKMQLGDILFSHAKHEAPSDHVLSAAISSLDWMGTVPADVSYRLTALLSPYGMLFSSYDIPLPGHILICGPSGSGKTLLAKVSAKSVEACEQILAHIVFVSCSKLTLEKPSTIHQALSRYISEALDHAPSLVILDDLDSLFAPSSDLEGSQPSPSSAALVEFLADILDEYEARLHEKRRSFCGIGPIAFIATVQQLTSFPQSLSSSGRFDFHVNLPAPAAAERSGMLRNEIQKRSLRCPDDLLLDIASKCDGYDAYDLEILVDRTVHSAISRSLSSDLGSGRDEKPTLVKDDFLQAMQDFLPVAMRDITKPANEGGRSGWEDVGGLDDIRNSIKEVHS
ncbi:peroxisome biogenesis protein 1 [Striga asiatica]|uniref:Peroxisomal ATPase PEX1 n=1 Tax=Striga asiatica TaxID=4170 RepID=A0A5A7QVN5_STRAF|nr:peroxisome biogenesis protein 1 [Striga asiatica]